MPEPSVQRTVEYFLQCQQPDGAWENASSAMADDDPGYPIERLAKRRKSMPQFEHRVVRRTTVVTTEQEPIDA